MKKLLVITSALLLTCAAAAAHADSVTYTVSVDTSSQKGNSGYIDLELNAGSLPAADVMAAVTGFSGATLNPGDPNNFFLNANGSLDSEVDLDNQTGNDYFEGLTFGDTVNFTVTLSGAGVSSTGSIFSDSGTVFQLEFLDPTQSTFLFTNDQNNPATVITIGNDGTASVAALDGTTAVATPEPTTITLVALGGVLVFAARRWRPRAA